MTDKAFDEWLKQTPGDVDQWMIDGLKIGLERFNLATGIISTIKDGAYVIRQATTTLGKDLFQPGDEFELKNTYCEAVTNESKTITYIQAGAIPEMRIHPVYVAVQLESYIGAPILDANKKVVGTVNFSSHEIKNKEFSTEDINFIERMAEKLSQYLPV